MNFFAHQKDARRRTFFFACLFALTVMATEVLILGAASFALQKFQQQPGQNPVEPRAICLMDPSQCEGVSLSSGQKLEILTGIGLLTALIIFGSCFYRSRQLRSEGSASVALDLGGEPLPEKDEDGGLVFKRFRNIVEEMSIASRVPTPVLYWLPKEKSINAFVAGYTSSDAVLTVTRGALDRLSRDELQGVVAHEFSHLLNGDMRLNTSVTSWLFGIYSLYSLGRAGLDSVLHTDPDIDFRRVAGAFYILVGVSSVVLLVIGSIGYFFGRLLQAALSRQREYLADASAVQFTRQNKGLAGALEKILYSSSAISSPYAATYNHFFLGESAKHSSLLATHPPLLKRIWRLDPCFKPLYSVKEGGNHQDKASAYLAKLDAEKPLGFAAMANQPAPTIEALPQTTLGGSFDSVVFLFACLLQIENAELLQKQRQIIENAKWGKGVFSTSESIARELIMMRVYKRLSKVREMLGKLHLLSADQRTRLKQTMKALVAADGQVSLLEIAATLMVRQFIDEIEAPSKTKMAGLMPLSACAQEIELARTILLEKTDTAPRNLMIDSLSEDANAKRSQAVANALQRLNRLSIEDKKRFFQTLADAIPGNLLTPDQEEILAVFAICLHTPPVEQIVQFKWNKFQLAPK